MMGPHFCQLGFVLFQAVENEAECFQITSRCKSAMRQSLLAFPWFIAISVDER